MFFTFSIIASLEWLVTVCIKQVCGIEFRTLLNMNRKAFIKLYKVRQARSVSVGLSLGEKVSESSFKVD
ncbi:hypothetical protein BV924_16440 [Pectobacterium odoriferum]|uniref:Secreted protein n=1 Tax=Pectobacterium odoriferum TaxID=78398 RepID=A0ABD6VNT3_9GAMM|nr:hypothetical protein BV924_16440 [Pectobacterium odoriferum]POE25362.1 hypothetical protein BV926_16370 [Pectobacterium odoriferum]POE29726.1 hypothetical protein BV919_16390 [Pectobacterium odoriferum]POE38389.1 hypothetical protein BV920_16870 [Pectobacterium odoriferum]